MTVHDGKDANYTQRISEYQKNTAVSSLTASQKFRLEQVSSNGGYLLRAMCSSDGTNRVVDIQRVATENFVKSGNNAYPYTATAPKTQQWFIVGVGTNQFKISSDSSPCTKNDLPKLCSVTNIFLPRKNVALRERL